MSRFFSIFSFLVYKFIEVLAACYLLRFFTMRTDMLLAGFYIFLSAGQFVFLFVQSLTRPRNRFASNSIFQYTTILTILMDLIILALSAYYLDLQKNDLFNLFFIITLLTINHILFYLAHSGIFSLVIRRGEIAVNKVSILPILLFLFFSFAIPLAYIITKTLFYGTLTKLDIYLVSLVFFMDMVSMAVLMASRALKAARIGRALNRLDPSFLTEDQMLVDDAGEFGYLQTQIKNFLKLISNVPERKIR